VREIVMVIADVYLPPGAAEAAIAAGAFFHDVPGIEYAGRFGARAALAAGWREWLAESLGRADLAGVAPACIAAAAIDAAAIVRGGATNWIATAVHLRAGLTRVHLDHRGILRLSGAQQSTLAADFAHVFGSSGYELTPLPSGDFLLTTPGITPVPTTEPARCAGGEVAQGLPHGTAAGPLRRLLAEIEMWLHGQALNDARRAQGMPPVTALWLWGAAGRRAQPQVHPAGAQQQAFGRDAYLNGLCHLQASECRALPQALTEVLADSDAQRVILVLEAGGELHSGFQGTVAEALAQFDSRFVSPALRALRRGECAKLTLIVNDRRVTLRRASGLRRWRRSRAGLGAFA
jgi:hypothetical protein